MIRRAAHQRFSESFRGVNYKCKKFSSPSSKLCLIITSDVETSVWHLTSILGYNMFVTISEQQKRLAVKKNDDLFAICLKGKRRPFSTANLVIAKSFHFTIVILLWYKNKIKFLLGSYDIEPKLHRIDRCVSIYFNSCMISLL